MENLATKLKSFLQKNNRKKLNDIRKQATDQAFKSNNQHRLVSLMEYWQENQY